MRYEYTMLQFSIVCDVSGKSQREVFDRQLKLKVNET